VSGNDINAAIEMRKESRSHPNTIKNFFLHIPNVLENKVKVKSKKNFFFVKCQKADIQIKNSKSIEPAFCHSVHSHFI